VAKTLKFSRQEASLLAKAFGVGFIGWLDGWFECTSRESAGETGYTADNGSDHVERPR
jgi:hypothetical protein